MRRFLRREAVLRLMGFQKGRVRDARRPESDRESPVVLIRLNGSWIEVGDVLQDPPDDVWREEDDDRPLYRSYPARDCHSIEWYEQPDHSA